MTMHSPRGFRVVMACDERYAAPLATALRSLVEANLRHWPIDVYILSPRLSPATQLRVAGSLPRDAASIEYIYTDVTGFKSFTTRPHISHMTFARLLLTDVLSHVTGRILYLDSDVLVLKDLGRIWETDMRGSVVAAVRDDIDEQIKRDRSEYDDVPRVRNYFNAGVLLIDMDAWRVEQISERAITYLTEHPTTRFSDQDALNVACDGRWKELQPAWNFQDLGGQLGCRETPFASVDADKLPAIVHFVTNRKPWDPYADSANATFYDSFRRRTAFARTRTERIAELLVLRYVRLRRSLSQYLLLRSAWTCWKRIIRCPTGYSCGHSNRRPELDG